MNGELRVWHADGSLAAGWPFVLDLGLVVQGLGVELGFISITFITNFSKYSFFSSKSKSLLGMCMAKM